MVGADKVFTVKILFYLFLLCDGEMSVACVIIIFRNVFCGSTMDWMDLSLIKLKGTST